MPWLSSSAPGPSPTKTRRAFGLPTPKTRFLRPEHSLQRLQSPRALRTSSRSVGLSGPRAGTAATAGAGARWTAGARAVEPSGRGEPERAGAAAWITASSVTSVTSVETSRYSTTTGGTLDPSTVTRTDIAAEIASSVPSAEGCSSSPATSRCQPRYLRTSVRTCASESAAGSTSSATFDAPPLPATHGHAEGWHCGTPIRRSQAFSRPGSSRTGARRRGACGSP